MANRIGLCAISPSDCEAVHIGLPSFRLASLSRRPTEGGGRHASCHHCTGCFRRFGREHRSELRLPERLCPLRYSFLLSGAMNRRNVWRTTPPAFGSFRIGNRSIWLASLALPVALVIPAIWYVTSPSPAPAHDIETVIKSYYGFDPLTPPSRLRGPGAIYHVNGSSVRKVCEATPEVLGGFVDESITVNRTHNSSENSRFSLSGSFVNALNGKLEGARVATIEYGMKDVVIREIPEATLGKIERVLMSEKDCDDTVNALLSANKRVCSGYSSLTASISYKVRFDRRTESRRKPKSRWRTSSRRPSRRPAAARSDVRNAEEFSGEKSDLWHLCSSTRCLVLDASCGRTSGAGRPPPQHAQGPKT